MYTALSRIKDVSKLVLDNFSTNGYKKIFANKNILHKLCEEKDLHRKVVGNNKLISSDKIHEEYIQ